MFSHYWILNNYFFFTSINCSCGGHFQFWRPYLFLCDRCRFRLNLTHLHRLFSSHHWILNFSWNCCDSKSTSGHFDIWRPYWVLCNRCRLIFNWAQLSIFHTTGFWSYFSWIDQLCLLAAIFNFGGHIGSCLIGADSALI